MTQRKCLWRVAPPVHDTACECVRIRGADGSPCYMSKRPVSLFDWALFIKRDAYFKPKYWWNTVYMGKSLNGVSGGDGLLERVSFSWENGEAPVTNIDWHEAAAYCNWRSGRLPWFQEMEGADKTFTEETPVQSSKRGLLARMLSRGRSAEIKRIDVVRPLASEWCGEWWVDGHYGPDVRAPVGQRLRRLAGEQERMDPMLRRADIGFRIIFEKHVDAMRGS